ncbi:MAG: hypothetical protein WBO36_04685 [Saprospiraceae bacterium]
MTFDVVMWLLFLSIEKTYGTAIVAQRLSKYYADRDINYGKAIATHRQSEYYSQLGMF